MSRKVFTLLCIQDHEPTIVELFPTLGEAAMEFQRVLRDEPDFVEDEVGRTPGFLQPAVATARTDRGDLLMIVERTL